MPKPVASPFPTSRSSLTSPKKCFRKPLRVAARVFEISLHLMEARGNSSVATSSTAKKGPPARTITAMPSSVRRANEAHFFAQPANPDLGLGIHLPKKPGRSLGKPVEIHRVRVIGSLTG